MLVFVDTSFNVPESEVGWIRIGERDQGQSCFRYYHPNGSEVEDVLPTGLPEGSKEQICWSGSSGWYQSWYVLRDGEWIEEGTTAPWQLFT